ncbi:hypothetical protein IAT38_002092 [Cryptococcus sp. DSM 104549]
MSHPSRDTKHTIVHCDSEVIRAVVGVGELFPRPSVTLRACYAVPNASSSKGANTNGDVQMDGETPAPEVVSKSGWLVGEELVNAQKAEGWEETLTVRWPFRPSKEADDWDGREFILSHLYHLLNITIQSNTSPLLLLPPSSPSLPLSSQALYTQMAFESLNTPQFSIIPSPLAGLFALNAVTGLVVSIGRNESSVFVVTDSIVRWECSATADVGEADCEEWFEGLLMEDLFLEQELKTAAEKDELPADEKRKLVKEVALVGDTAPPPASHSHKSKKQQAQAQAAATKAAADAAAALQNAPLDTIVINIPSLPGKEIQLGPVRHRLCEPLLKGKVPGGDTVWEAVGRAVDSAGLMLSDKLSLWDGVAVTGELARVKSFAPALVTYLSPFLLSSPDLPSDCQPAKMRLLAIPEYFANYRKCTTELAPFLGGTLMAKAIFTEAAGKHAISKVDYNAKGPEAIYAVGDD